MSKFLFACLEHLLSTQLPEMVWVIFETLRRAAARNHLLSTGINISEMGFMMIHVYWVPYLLMFSHIQRNTSYSFCESYERVNFLPSEMKWGNQYVLSSLPTAMPLQYLMGLKLCGTDCSGHDSGHHRQAVLLLKFSICSTKKETITQVKE